MARVSFKNSVTEIAEKRRHSFSVLRASAVRVDLLNRLSTDFQLSVRSLYQEFSNPTSLPRSGREIIISKTAMKVSEL
jgi:hypothetical protein